MTEKTATCWLPEQDLTALLDALTEELFIVRDEEVAACLRETGAAGRDVVEAMRRLVAAADTGPMLPAVSTHAAAAARAHSSRQ
jgi:hypothetical protein